ncbi:MAG TPA: response regulator transcription factor [Elusimicrobiota bacterium]|jgi:DNA-binding response OmpR family regulator|nr:response regulator transcription factor [Elusimicrobiota bacterium]HMU95926.1 response regulator transcription factor [Elusimicrobiota bacterium]HMX42199.1 response regulator transcription factor [Elusimicrobiota bacterium]HMZ26120.1 response regulator transcription factor [Elusimicrobiota bacterium]HNA60819.1 response regulator transcription factor [Elusimicrobiota bacterium]
MLKKRIMVVDDDKDIRRLVENILSKEGFVTVGAENAADALKKIQNSKPDLIILDLQLPDKDGFEVCKQLRADPATRYVPVVFLTVQNVDSYKIAGLEIGADDYITKPFNQTELVARVKAVLRRVDWRDKKEAALRDGQLAVDMEKHSVHMDAKPLDLSPKEFDLLVSLLRNHGKVMTRAELSETVWGHEYFGNTRTVDVHVGRLRKKLGKMGEKIRTVERIGYRYE